MNIKTVFCLASMMAATAAFAAQNDTLVTFSTPGPDKYADGTTVPDGECYALVWMKDGTLFEGIAADGKAANTNNAAVLLVAPIAKGGRCPTTAFEISAKIMDRYQGGKFGIYLLDTRLANGAVGGVNSKGAPVAVNGYGAVGETAQDGVASVDATVAAGVTAVSAIPADAPQPVIKSIEVKGGNVYLTVENTAGYLKYGANSVDINAGTEEATDSAAVQGAFDKDVIIVTPAKGSSGFFKVGRR